MMTIAKYTDKGGRPINEDSIGVFQKDDVTCAVLCDGLGGHGMGDIASQTAVQSFGALFEKNYSERYLDESFGEAQKSVMEKQSELQVKDKMKTTAVVAVIEKSFVKIGHIGDSRAYVFKRNKVKCRTIDHSVPQMLVNAGEIKEKEIRNHPDRSRLLRVIGVEWSKPMFDIKEPLRRKKCDAILLCSDGFWELIEEKEMENLLKKSSTVEEWLNSMLEIVNKNGVGREMDNNSAIAIWL